MGIGFQTAARQAIELERQRQISSEGWTAEHDDQHDDGSLLRVAVIYYQHTVHGDLKMREDGAPVGWPWDREWWKPKERTRNLERAGALCLAEKARLKRNGAPYSHADQKLNLIINALARR